MGAHWYEVQADFVDGKVDAQQLSALRTLFFGSPTPEVWNRVLSRLGLFFGVGMMLAGVIFIVAFNWAALGVLTKMSMAAGLFASSAVLSLVFRGQKLTGQVLTGMTGLTIGPLLILYTQAYQTGSDPWQLFLIWALLASPWVLMSRLSGMWIVIWVLLRVSILLFGAGGINDWDLLGAFPYWIACAVLDVVFWAGLHYKQSGFSKLPSFFAFFTLLPFPIMMVDRATPVAVTGTLLLFAGCAAAIWFSKTRNIYLPLLGWTSLGVALNGAFTLLTIDFMDIIALWLSSFALMFQTMLTAVWVRYRMNCIATEERLADVDV